MWNEHLRYQKKVVVRLLLQLIENSDTESLAYQIETEDFYKDINKDVGDKLDSSNYLEDHVSGIPTGRNKKVVGMMKDEAGRKIIEESVRLGAKLYSY